MNGILVPLMKQTHLDFSYLGNLGSEKVKLAFALNVIYFNQAVLFARVHQNKLGAGATFNVKCYPTAPSEVDQQVFTETTADVTLTIGSGDAAPKYLKATASVINGPYWMVELTATQASTATTLAAQLSVGLVLRNT